MSMPLSHLFPAYPSPSLCPQVYSLCLHLYSGPTPRFIRTFFFFKINLFYLFIFGCVGSLLLRAGFSLVVASGGYSLLRCAGFSLPWLLLLRSTGSRHVGSVVVAHWLSCSAACGIFPDKGSNPCPLRWQADFQPLCHQGSPEPFFFKIHAFFKKKVNVHCKFFRKNIWENSWENSGKSCERLQSGSNYEMGWVSSMEDQVLPSTLFQVMGSCGVTTPFIAFELFTTPWVIDNWEQCKWFPSIDANKWYLEQSQLVSLPHCGRNQLCIY